MKQIVVLSDDHPNAIAEMIEAVGASGASLETLETEIAGGLMVAVLTVDQYDRALRGLARAGLHAVSEEAILIRLADRPGALAEIARRFHVANVPLRSVRILRRTGESDIIALSSPRTEEALRLVQDVLIA